MSRGSATVEVLAVGVLMIGGLLHTLSTAAQIQAGADAAAEAEAAAIGARWGAHHGDAETARRASAAVAPPGARIVVGRNGDRLGVVVRIEVPLIGPAGSPLMTTVSGRATAEVAPHRSGR